MESCKNYIETEAINLQRADKINILKIVMKHDMDLIKESADGCRINLNTLPDNIIKNIYKYIRENSNSDLPPL